MLDFLFLFSKEVAILCSFFLGLGDSCFNTQLLSILGFLYSEDSAPAFAVFKFIQVISVTKWPNWICFIVIDVNNLLE